MTETGSSLLCDVIHMLIMEHAVSYRHVHLLRFVFETVAECHAGYYDVDVVYFDVSPM